jgi:predicted ATPase
LAASPIDDLLIKEKGTEENIDEVFAFDRTLSRLKEMQSQYYFNKPHKFYVDGEANE